MEIEAGGMSVDKRQRILAVAALRWGLTMWWGMRCESGTMDSCWFVCEKFADTVDRLGLI